MQYPTYQKYKPSRLEWIDVIPQHWDITRLRLLSKRYSGGTPSKDNQAYWQDGTIPWLNSGAVNQGTITRPSTYITELGLKESSAKWVPKKAIIIALAGQGKTKGTAAYTTFKTTCNQSMGVVVFEKDHPKFMYWWLTSQYKNIRGLASDDGRDGLNLEMLGTIPCPLPSIKEQMQITAFLDYKTQKIDHLIEKKKELIEKLEEQRRAVITQAVTKGIDKNAKLKPSGVDWLGDVPEHWVVTRTKFNVSYIGSGKTPSGGSEVYVDDGIIMLRSQNVYDEGLRLANVVRITEDADRLQLNSRVNEHDVLLNITGASIGRVSIVPVGFPVSNVNQHVCIVRPEQEKIDPRYLHLQLCSNVAKHQIWMNQVGTSREGLNFPQVGDLTFSLPDLVEQQSILEFCEIETIRNKQMKVKVEAAIAKLEEYRSAIITSAVTGKIDVRAIEIPKEVV